MEQPNANDNQIKRNSHAALGLIEGVILFVIAVVTMIATAQEILLMVDVGKVTVADILLLFIYLEVFAMIGVYLKSGRLPLRMPIYIAIVALARYLILDMKSMTEWQMLTVAIAILLLALTTLVHRFGHVRFPYEK